MENWLIEKNNDGLNESMPFGKIGKNEKEVTIYPPVKIVIDGIKCGSCCGLNHIRKGCG